MKKNMAPMVQERNLVGDHFCYSKSRISTVRKENAEIKLWEVFYLTDWGGD